VIFEAEWRRTGLWKLSVVAADGVGGIGARLEGSAPDERGFPASEKRLNMECRSSFSTLT
jgi:hypothetical protein